jgi:hypothetical protein
MDLEVWLAGYIDGELEESQRAWVECWLADHADARANLEAQQQVRQWVDLCPVPQPDPSTWDGLLARVEDALASGPAVPASVSSVEPAPSGRPRRWLGALGIAAAVLLAAWVGQYQFRDRKQPGQAPPGVTRNAGQDALLRPGERLEVVGADDVRVLSMNAEDTGALVVAEPPVSGELLLASPEDVVVNHMAPYPIDDMTPSFHAPKGGAPMVVVPLKAVARNGP